jgi:hypothetical protein
MVIFDCGNCVLILCCSQMLLHSRVIQSHPNIFPSRKNVLLQAVARVTEEANGEFAPKKNQ